jgi:hypothetical protein
MLQSACVSSPNAIGSNLFITGNPYTFKTCPQFITSVYTAFNRNKQSLLTLHGNIEVIIVFVHLKTMLPGYISDRLNSVCAIATVSMKGRISRFSMQKGSCPWVVK